MISDNFCREFVAKFNQVLRGTPISVGKLAVLCDNSHKHAGNDSRQPIRAQQITARAQTLIFASGALLAGTKFWQLYLAR